MCPNKLTNNINNNDESFLNSKREDARGTIMVRKYKKPPLIESVCEFTFPSEVNWDSTVIGLFYDQMKKFPLKYTKSKPLCDRLDEEDINECPDFMRQEYTIFSNNDKIFDIGITERKLVVRAIKPYKEWEDFREVISDSYSKLSKIINAKECEVKFNYANIIELPSGKKFSPNEISNYFCFSPKNDSQKLPNVWDHFITGYSHKYTNKNLLCRLTLSSTTTTDNKRRGYFLEISISSLKSVKSANVQDWLDNSHKIITDVFEGCITDKLREILIPV